MIWSFHPWVHDDELDGYMLEYMHHYNVQLFNCVLLEIVQDY